MHVEGLDRPHSALQRTVVQRSDGRASILDLNKYIDPAGVWTDTVNGIKVRTFDKMHLSSEGRTSHSGSSPTPRYDA